MVSTRGEATGLLHFSLIGGVTLAVVAAGVAISVWLFGPRRDIPLTQPATSSPFILAGRNDLYGDAFNEAVFMRPGQRLTDGLLRVEDSGIDGTVNGTAAAIGGLSTRLRRVPERLRPLVRADHDCGRRRRRRRHHSRSAGLRTTIMTLPWLTVLALVPAIGAVVRGARRRPAGQADRAGHLRGHLRWSR